MQHSIMLKNMGGFVWLAIFFVFCFVVVGWFFGVLFCFGFFVAKLEMFAFSESQSVVFLSFGEILLRSCL